MSLALQRVLPVGDAGSVAVTSVQLPLQSASVPQRGMDAHDVAHVALPAAVRQHVSPAAQFAALLHANPVTPGAHEAWHEVPVRTPSPVRVSQHN